MLLFLTVPDNLLYKLTSDNEFPKIVAIFYAQESIHE